MAEKSIDITKTIKRTKANSEAFKEKRLSAIKKIKYIFKFSNFLENLLIYAFLALIAFGVAWFLIYFLDNRESGNKEKKSFSSFTSQKIEENKETASTTKTETGIAFEEKVSTTTTGATTSTTAANEINKTSFKIRVLNGTGVNGDAAKMKTRLTDAGYATGSIGNAKNMYEKTQIYYIEGKGAEAKLVQKELSDRQTELVLSTPSVIGVGYQVLVVVGSK